MKKTSVALGILLLGAWAIFTGFAPQELKKDFVSFDRAFIPPLALTKQGKAMPSKKAMNPLRRNWAAFRAKYYDANPGDPQWKGDFDHIGKAIAEADEIVKSGINLKEAHESLEEIRDVTLNLRKRNNIDYYLDLLNEFHPLMEEIFHFGEDNQPADLTAGGIKSIEDTLYMASAMWTKIENSPFDKDLFGFNDQKIKKMGMFIKMEREALEALSAVIKADNRPMILKSAKGVQPNYAKLFKMFGDFESLKK